VYDLIEVLSRRRTFPGLEMRENTMLKIGEFARIAQVSIATLRHYDQYGLLKPSALDPQSGYRYYALDQLPRLNRIVALKDLGFPLEQIARLLEEDLSLEQLQGMFKLKQEQIRQVIDVEQTRLEHIATRLRQIEQEGTMPTYDVRLKQVEPLLVANIRGMIALGGDLTEQHKKIVTYLNQQGIQQIPPDIMVWHTPHKMRDDGIYADVEIAIPLSTSLPSNEQINVHTLPGGLMACIVHTGHTFPSGQAFAALHRWQQDNGYRFTGPPRQVHLQNGSYMETSQDVIEVQFPVEKVSE
jgi:DNA-binding transcriptional MerR regulator